MNCWERKKKTMRKPHVEFFNFQIYSSALSLFVRSTGVLWHSMNLEFYLIKNTHVSFVFFPVMGKVLMGNGFLTFRGPCDRQGIGGNE